MFYIARPLFSIFSLWGQEKGSGNIASVEWYQQSQCDKLISIAITSSRYSYQIKSTYKCDSYDVHVLILRSYL